MKTLLSYLILLTITWCFHPFIPVASKYISRDYSRQSCLIEFTVLLAFQFHPLSLLSYFLPYCLLFLSSLGLWCEKNIILILTILRCRNSIIKFLFICVSKV